MRRVYLLLLLPLCLTSCIHNRKIAKLNDDIAAVNEAISSRQASLEAATGEEKVQIEAEIVTLIEKREELEGERAEVRAQAERVGGGLSSLLIFLSVSLGIPFLATAAPLVKRAVMG